MENISMANKKLIMMKRSLEEIRGVIDGTGSYWQGEVGERVRDEFSAILEEYAECVQELQEVLGMLSDAGMPPA